MDTSNPEDQLRKPPLTASSPEVHKPAPPQKKKMHENHRALLILSLLFACFILGILHLTFGYGGGSEKETSLTNNTSSTFLDAIAGEGPQVGTVYINSQIGTANAQVLVRRIDSLTDNDNVHGIILDINSPGGSVGGTQLISRAIDRFREETGKPIYAVVNDLAASGGYWIAAKADKIFSLPGSILGSIGVVRPGVSISGLLEKIGVKNQTLTAGKFKSSGTFLRDLTENETSYIQSILNEMHTQFIQAVIKHREGRGTTPLTREKFVEIADGRIMLGEKALELGLIDEIGSFEDARKMMENLLIKDKKIKEDDKLKRLDPEKSFFEHLEGAFSSVRAASSAASNPFLPQHAATLLGTDPFFAETPLLLFGGLGGNPTAHSTMTTHSQGPSS